MSTTESSNSEQMQAITQLKEMVSKLESERDIQKTHKIKVNIK
jgi:hypothetical protein